MSNNYYATKTEVIIENLDEDGLSVTVSKTTRIHIGKSSGGWAFALHIYPKLGMTGIFDMMHQLKDGWTIEMEMYGEIDLDTLREHMKLPKAPVHRSEHRVGSCKSCDYFTSSFC